jgi:transcription elongation factor Elf1
MSNQFFCEVCHDVPMDLTRKVGTKQSGKSYRQRWFKCPVCGYEKKVYADGERDEVSTPYFAIKAIKRLYKQQEKNN